MSGAVKKKPREWTCDGCGRRATWRSGWGYLDGIESPANSPDAAGLLLPLAGCSEKCTSAALDRLRETAVDCAHKPG